MLTIFAIPKAFERQVGNHQCDAIRTWMLLPPRRTIVLSGNEPGTTETASQPGTGHIPEVGYNEYGTPLSKPVFSNVQESAGNSLPCCADSIFLGDLLAAIKGIHFGTFLIVGQDWNIDVSRPMAFTRSDWVQRIGTFAMSHGTLDSRRAGDYFVFSRGSLGDLLEGHDREFVLDDAAYVYSDGRVVRAFDKGHLAHKSGRHAALSGKRGNAFRAFPAMTTDKKGVNVPRAGAMKKTETATLILEGKEYHLPVVHGSEGERAIDVSRLYQETGCITLDQGFSSTGSCKSEITFIDGAKGILRYRGYPIEELAEKSTFVETAYLLLYGELPSPGRLNEFSDSLNESSLIHEDMLHFFTGFPKDSHPMGILATTVASLSTFYPVPDKLDQASERRILANLISQIRTIAAISYKKSMGEPIVYPSYKLNYVQNFLNMMFSTPVRDFAADEDIVRAIDLFLLLHADHEQNCSTSAVRMVGSSLSNVYAVVSSGIAALWGQRHGGANQAVMNMLNKIHRDGGDGTEFIDKAKEKNSPDRLMGFGHRVYKTFDPRAQILKKQCHKILNKPGMSDPLFDIALRMEEVALRDDYFLSRNLYPNVDFYSGLILRAAGIPTKMFTVLFAIGRTPGWLAHWREMYHASGFSIARPRQLYTGHALRNYDDSQLHPADSF